MLTCLPSIGSDGKLDFNEFQEMIGNTDIARQLTLEVSVSDASMEHLLTRLVLPL
jgi:hypothetical protein